MSRELIFEYYSIGKSAILEEGLIDEKKADSHYIKAEVKFSQAGKPNNNRRMYPKDLMLREVDRIKLLCKEGKVSGGAYHPTSGVLDIPQVCHLWEDVWMEEDGACAGIIKILPTTHGREAQTILKAGGQIFFSSRGFGTVTHKVDRVEGKKFEYDEVNSDYKMLSPGDAVLTPSVPDAGVRKLIEQKANEAFFSDNEKLIQEEKLEKEKKPNIETLEDLRKEFPEMVEKAEKSAVEAAMKAEKEKAEGEKSLEEQKKEWKEEVMKEVQPKLEKLEKASTEMIESIREAATTLTDIPGVIPEEEKKKIDKENVPQVDEALQKEVENLKAKIAEMDKEKEDATEAEKKAKEKSEAEEAISKALEDELKKDENEKYADFIRKNVKAGRLVITDVEKIPDAIKAERERISDLAVELKKSEIIKDTEEKGLVENPDKPAKKELTEAQILKLYEYARSTNYEGTLEEYKSNVLKLEG